MAPTSSIALALGLCVAACISRAAAFAFVPVGGAPLAGRSCRATTARMAVLDVGSEEELDKTLKGAGDSLVVVDYSTTWCGPCKVIYPKFEALSEQYKNAVFVKVVGDSSQAATKLMKREGVRSVPAFHFWKDGKKVDTVSGANSEALENGVKDYA